MNSTVRNANNERTPSRTPASTSPSLRFATPQKTNTAALAPLQLGHVPAAKVGLTTGRKCFTPVLGRCSGWAPSRKCRPPGAAAMTRPPGACSSLPKTTAPALFPEILPGPAPVSAPAPAPGPNRRNRSHISGIFPIAGHPAFCLRNRPKIPVLSRRQPSQAHCLLFHFSQCPTRFSFGSASIARRNVSTWVCV